MYRLKLIHSHPPRMRRRLMTSSWRFWHRLHIFDYVCIHFFWNNIFALFKPLWFFSVQTCVGVLCLRSRGHYESSTWDSTRLQTVVFVMWSFWPFVSCPATQYATTCNNFKIFEIPCNKNSNKVSCHIAHANAILSLLDWNSNRNSMDAMSRRMTHKQKTHNFFNQLESSILLSSATLLAL